MFHVTPDHERVAVTFEVAFFLFAVLADSFFRCSFDVKGFFTKMSRDDQTAVEFSPQPETFFAAGDRLVSLKFVFQRR